MNCQTLTRTWSKLVLLIHVADRTCKLHCSVKFCRKVSSSCSVCSIQIFQKQPLILCIDQRPFDVQGLAMLVYSLGMMMFLDVLLCLTYFLNGYNSFSKDGPKYGYFSKTKKRLNESPPSKN